MSDIQARVIGIVGSTFPKAAGSVTGETTAAQVEGWDSLGHINLVLALEKEFGVKLRPAKVARLKNVTALAEHIQSLM